MLCVFSGGSRKTQLCPWLGRTAEQQEETQKQPSCLWCHLLTLWLQPRKWQLLVGFKAPLVNQRMSSCCFFYTEPLKGTNSLYGWKNFTLLFLSCQSFPSMSVLGFVLFQSPALPCKCSWTILFFLWDRKRSLECQFASSAVQPAEINSSARPLFLLCMCPALDPRLFSLALVTPNEL